MNDRLDRIEKILEEMAARQQYHDEAFDRTDEAIKANNEQIANLTITMDRLANIVIRHEERLDDIQGEA